MNTKSPPPGDTSENGGSFNPEFFALNIARVMEEGGKALAAYLKPRENGGASTALVAGEMSEVAKTLTTVMQYWLSDPHRAAEMQTTLGKSYLDLWGHMARRMGQNAGMLDCPPFPRATYPRLDFVNDQQYPVSIAQSAQLGEEVFAGSKVAAFTLNWLNEIAATS